MQFSDMLEELIKASRTQKQALSSALLYSPSEVSKYLSGQRLPSPASIQEMADRCAVFFAEAFWTNGFGEGFDTLFPMLVPFRDRQELEDLLRMALLNAYRISSQTAAGSLAQRAGSDTLLTGWPDIVRTLTLNMSEAARGKQSLDSYYTLDVYTSLLERRSLPLPTSWWGGSVNINILVSPINTLDELNLNKLQLLLEHWISDKARYELRFFEGPQVYVQPAVFVPESFTLQMLASVPGLPAGAFFRSARYLMEYELYNLTRHTKPISFSSREALQAMLQNPEKAMDMLAGCEAIFAFDSVSFFLSEREMDMVPGDAQNKQLVLDVLTILRNLPIPMVVSYDAVGYFSNTGRAIIPMLGLLELDALKSVTYMQSYNTLLAQEKHATVYATRRTFARATFLLLKDYLLIMMPLSSEAEQKFLLLPRSMCGYLVNELKSILQSEAALLSDELWGHFLRHLPNMRRDKDIRS